MAEEFDFIVPDEPQKVDRKKYRRYSPELLPIIREFALLGCTEERFCRALNIDRNEFVKWKKEMPEVYEAVQEGRDIADSKVAAALYKRAVGFTCKEQHVSIYKGVAVVTEVDKYYPPDPFSAMKWLQTRQRDTWSESHRLEILNTNVNVDYNALLGKMSDDELMLLRNIQLKQIGKTDAGN